MPAHARVLLILFLIASLPALGQSVTYTDPGGRFSINVPSGWKSDNSPSALAPVKGSAVVLSRDSQTNLHVIPSPSSTGVGKQVAATSSQLIGKGAKLVKESPLKIASGQTATLQVFSYRGSLVLFAWVDSGGKLYQVIASAPSSGSAQLGKTLVSTIASLNTKPVVAEARTSTSTSSGSKTITISQASSDMDDWIVVASDVLHSRDRNGLKLNFEFFCAFPKGGGPVRGYIRHSRSGKNPGQEYTIQDSRGNVVSGGSLFKGRKLDRLYKLRGEFRDGVIEAEMVPLGWATPCVFDPKIKPVRGRVSSTGVDFVIGDGTGRHFGKFSGTFKSFVSPTKFETYWKNVNPEKILNSDGGRRVWKGRP